jgi:hypothetical protein
MPEEVAMLSRGKLVQDWNRRLAAADAEGAKKHSLKWLYQMRVRLYRFLLSCYRQGDWRADEPSISTDDTLADVAHGETTTLLDCPLDGKPAKHTGKMQAVLKSVSAAQDHPAESGPLLAGAAADEWVVVVSVRDELRINRCQDVLRQHGIASTWTLQDEITVRLFDLERARQIIRMYRDSLHGRLQAAFVMYPPSAPATNWPARLGATVVILAPAFSICGLLLLQCVFVVLRLPLLEGPPVAIWFAICFFGTIAVSALLMHLQDVRRERHKRQEASKLAEEERSTKY